MKRINLTFAIAALAVISAPLSAQGDGGKYDRNNGVNSDVYDRNGDGVIDNRDRSNTNGCRWWEINCSNANSSFGGGWHQIGRDSEGNGIYERRVADRRGNVVIQTARRERNGRLRVIDTYRVNDRRNHGRFDRRDARRVDRRLDRRGNRRGDDDDDDRYSDRDRDR